MMIVQLSLFATLSVVILLSSQCASQATLTQTSAEVKLDGSESMELVCSVTGSISNSRVWTGGPGFQPIITNGVSTDSSKYTETIHTADFRLNVHNVIVDDVCDVDFKCSNGFSNSPTVTIVLNSSIFIYVPTASDIQINEEYDDKMKMTVLVNLTTVFPEPTCKAERGTTLITSQLQSNSYNNGNCGLKTTELRITNETYDCSGQVVITCNVGSQSIVVFTGKSPCPTVTTEMASTSTSQDQIASSQNPSMSFFHNTEKTETTIMTTTDNDLTSSFLHVSSEVTTPIKTESDNLTYLGVSAIIAIAISGFVFLSLIIILIICYCQYYRNKSKKKTSEEFKEKHDDVVPKLWPNFNSHRYGLNEINGSNVHLARGYNLYQGEYDRGYNVLPTDQSDNYNRSKPKQVQEKISHGFPQSIPDDIMNRHYINGIHTYPLHDNNQNTRTYYRKQGVWSARRFEYRGYGLPHECNNHNRSSPYITYLQEHVPRDLEGLTIYKGYGRATNKGPRRYY